MENPEADTGNDVDNGNSLPDKEETAMETVMQAQRFPHLLELIGKKMDLKDLWKLRQTCLTWNKEFIPAMRDKQKPISLQCDWKDVIVPTQKNATTTTSDIASASPPNSLPKPSLRGYTDIMRSSKVIPITKYTLIDIDIESKSKPGRPLVLADFFQLCGTYITHLKLCVGGTYNNRNAWDPVRPVDIGSLRQIIFHQVPNLKDLLVDLPHLPLDTPTLETQAVATRDLPQLRKLSFSVIRVGSVAINGLHSMYRRLLADLIRSTTGLDTLEFGRKNLECSAWDFSQGPPSLEAIMLVREVMSEEQVSKIKTLKIQEVQVPHLEIMLDLAGRDRRKNPLRLKSFFTSIVHRLYDLEMVNLDDVTETGQLLFRFLQSQADTLLELNFNNTIITRDTFPPVPVHASTINFPIMPAVRNLSLKLMGNRSYQLATPSDISFPGLVKYNYLNNTGYPFGEDMEGFGYLGLSLTDLSLDTGQYTEGASFLDVYGPRFQFQAITRLKIKLNASPARYIINGFKKICATMQVLEELDITCATYTNPKYGSSVLQLDSLLTGVPKVSLRHLERVLDNLAQVGPTSLPILQRFLTEYYKTEPSISNLRCLKKFVMDVPRIGYRLTNIGGYFGFACASHTLQYIAIQGGTDGGGRPLTARRSQVGRLSECQYPGNLVSVECGEMIRSIMSLPKVLRFDYLALNNN